MKRWEKQDARPKSIVLGSGAYLPWDGMEDAPNVFILGGSGCGKSFALTGPNLMQADGSCFVIDPSGGNYKMYGKYLEEKGFRVKCINLVKPKKGDHYNPLHYVQAPKDIESIAEVIRIYTEEKGKTGEDTPDSQDGVLSGKDLEDKSMALMKALMAHVAGQQFPLAPNFYNVLFALHSGDTASEVLEKMDWIFRERSDGEMEAYARENYRMFRDMPDRACIQAIAECAKRLQVFNDEDIAEMTKEDDVSLDDIQKEKTAVFVITPTSGEPPVWKRRILSATACMQCMDAVSRTRKAQGKECVHVSFFIEEPSSTARFPGIKQRMEGLKGHDASVILFIFAIVHMTKTYFGDDWEWAISTCGAAVFMGSFMFEGGLMERVTGYKEGIAQQQISKKRFFPFRLPFMKKRPLYDDGVFIIDNDRVAQLREDECIIALKGKPAFRTQKYMASSHPAWEEVKKLREIQIEEEKKKEGKDKDTGKEAVDADIGNAQ